MSTSPDFWSILRELHSVPEAAALVFRIVEELTRSSGGITVDNYEAAIALLNDFATAGSIGAAQEQRRDREAHGSRRGRHQQQQRPKTPKQSEEVMRGNKAMSIVFDMTRRIPSFISQSHLDRAEAWSAYWTPIFRVLSTQCLNPCREIRYSAFSTLQKTLLSKDLITANAKDVDEDAAGSRGNKTWTSIFSDVLFPLINQMLKPEVFATDPVGMGETRVGAAALLCKVFLHYFVLLSQVRGEGEGQVTLVDLWGRILGICDRLVNCGQGDNLVSFCTRPPGPETSFHSISFLRKVVKLKLTISPPAPGRSRR
jgi:golgi-specific brefeldin A-resistance guanine nucleotide exchange factor 1